MRFAMGIAAAAAHSVQQAQAATVLPSILNFTISGQVGRTSTVADCRP